MITDQLLALLPLDRQDEDAPGGDLEVSLRSVGGHQLTGLQGGEAAARPGVLLTRTPVHWQHQSCP